MVHVYATRRGYYYKTYKNGSKKRISEKEYLKKRNKKIYGGGGINKNNFSNVSLITDNSTEGLIWKVTYKNKDYVFKEFLKKEEEKEEMSDLYRLNTERALLQYKETGEIRKLELPIYQILSENSNILTIYDIVVDNKGDFQGLLTEYLDEDWVIVGEFCQSQQIADENFIKIGDDFLNALYFLNQYGFSIGKIEHYGNLMINTKTYNIKLIDIDGISHYKFINTKTEKDNFEMIIRSSNSDEKDGIPTSSLCKKILEYISEKYNFEKEYFSLSPIIEKQLTKISKINDEYEVALNIKRKEIINIEYKKMKNKIKKFIKKYSKKPKVSERYKIILDNEKLFFNTPDFDLNMLMSNPISSWSNIPVTTKRYRLKQLERLVRKIS